jgi:predicted dehydrogenase
MPKRKLRIALIGQGFMGRAHSNAFRQAGRFFDLPYDIDCAVICARNRENLGRMAATWGWAEAETDWRAVVERDDIDLVDVATPNWLHAEMAIRAAEAGKMVLCEKPMAVSAQEGARMVAAARLVPNMVWYNYRRVPAISFCRRLIEEGRVGRVFHYRATYLQSWGPDPARIGTWKTQRAFAGPGVLGDLGSHLIDTAIWLNGGIREVSAQTHTFIPGRDIEDASMFMARFENGSLGMFEATRFGIGNRNRNAFEINGEQGMLRFNLEDLNRLEFFDAADAANVQGPRNLLVTGPDHPYASNFWKPGHIIGYEHTFIAALADFLITTHEGREFHPNFQDAQKTQLVMDACERSAKSGCREQVGE